MRHASLSLLLALFVCVCLAFVAAGKAPLIIAHRGSPCQYPEETLEGYRQAALDGADYLELDVVSTQDGQLVCRHDITLDSSTDVGERPEFASRRRTVTLREGELKSGFFACNFTLAEIRTLYAKQVFPFRDHPSPRQFRVRTLSEVLTLAMNSTPPGRPLGVYIETKEPNFHDSIGLPLEPRVLDALEATGYGSVPAAPLILQSFDEESLRKLNDGLAARGLPGRAQLVWLLECARNVSDAELDAFALYGSGIGPEKGMLAPVVHAQECGRPRNATCAAQLPNQACAGRLADPGRVARLGGKRGVDSELLERAHQRGLVVHAYTFRNEGRFMAIDFASDPLAELTHFRELGVDGVFVDCPSTAREWLAVQGAQHQEAGTWLPYGLRLPGARQSAAVAMVSMLATLLAVTGCWALAALIRHRRRRAAKYDVFPLFGNGDVSWYPPDYRRAIIAEHQGERQHSQDEDAPLPTSIMMTPIDSPLRIADQRSGDLGPLRSSR